MLEEDFNRFMTTWDGQWGADVEYVYQHQQQHQQHQQQQQHLLLDSPSTFSSSFEEDEGKAAFPLMHYNRNSVLSIAPQALLPMIVSQVRSRDMRFTLQDIHHARIVS